MTTLFVAEVYFVTLTAKPLNKAHAIRKPRQYTTIIGLEPTCFEAKKTSSMWPFTHYTLSKGQDSICDGIRMHRVIIRPKMPSQPIT